MFKSGIVEGESSEVDSSQTVKGCENWSSQTLYTLGLAICVLTLMASFKYIQRVDRITCIYNEYNEVLYTHHN